MVAGECVFVHTWRARVALSRNLVTPTWLFLIVACCVSKQQGAWLRTEGLIYYVEIDCNCVSFVFMVSRTLIFTFL